MLGVPEWGVASWSLFGYVHWSLIQPWSEFRLAFLILKVQRRLISFKSSFGALGDAGGSWVGFGILILIQIWSLAFVLPCSKFWLYLYFEDAKNIHILKVLIWGLRGCWRIMTGVWHLDLDLDTVTGLWYTNVSNFGSLFWFSRCKGHPCPLCPHLGLWRMLEVSDCNP